MDFVRVSPQTGQRHVGYRRPANQANATAKRDKIETKSSIDESRELMSQSQSRLWSKASSLPQTLNLLAFQDDICLTFLTQRLFSYVEGGQGSILIGRDRSLVDSLAVKALATTFFGRVHGQKQLRDHGALLYGQALNEVSKNLLDPTLSDSPSSAVSSTIAATMTLGWYEIVSYTSTSGWRQHASGSGRLLEMSGPRKFQAQPDHGLFLAARSNILVQALADHKRTFLEQDDWKIIPWALDPTSKTSLNYLLDILCMLPGFLEDQDELKKAATFCLPSLWTSLKRRVQGQLDVLQDWKRDWDSRFPGAVFEMDLDEEQRRDWNERFSYTIMKMRQEDATAILKTNENLNTPNFGKQFHFMDINRANEFTLYNTCMILLFELLYDLEDADIPHSSSPVATLCQITNTVYPESAKTSPKSRLSVSGAKKIQRHCAINICRSVPYHLLQRHGYGGAYLLIFPLTVVMITWSEERGQDLAEKNWTIKLLRIIAACCGLSSATHVADTDWSTHT